MKYKIPVLSCMVLSFLYAYDHFEFQVDFLNSMQSTHQFDPVKMDRSMVIAQQEYEKYVLQGLEYQDKSRIPKIIHHIWLGSPLPEAQRQLRETWAAHHPGWELILWDEKAIEEFGLQNKKAYDAAINWAEKSDIARYEILYRIGGLYVDTDFECLKPFDILHHSLDFYIGLQYESRFLVQNSILASIPGHPILKKCIDHIQPRKQNDANLWNTLYRTGPFYLSGIIKPFLGEYPRVVMFPVTFFYPIPWWERNENWDLLRSKWIKPHSMAIHYWHVSWNDYSDKKAKE